MFDYTQDVFVSDYGLSSDAIFWTRAAFLMINSAFFVVPALGFSHLDVNLTDYTYWGFHLTELALLFSIWASRYSDPDASMFNYQPGAVWLTGLAQTTNILIALTFFTFAWFGPDSDYGFSTPEQWALLATEIPAHTIPLAFTSLNLYLLSDVSLQLADIWLVLIPTCVYGGITFLYSRLEPEYISAYFLTWDEPLTIYSALVLVPAALGAWVSQALLT